MDTLIVVEVINACRYVIITLPARLDCVCVCLAASFLWEGVEKVSDFRDTTADGVSDKSF